MNKIKSFFLVALIGALPISANAIVISNGILTVGVNSNGTINDLDQNVGIQSTDYIGADYTFPGTPFQYHSIGYNGSYTSDLFATTTFSSSSAQTIGTYGDLQLNQTMSLVGKQILFTTTLTNTGSSSVFEVAFSSGFDPDQDVFTYGTFNTRNEIGTGRVTATGEASGKSISIFGNGAGSISAAWDMSPYTVYNDGDGDNTIAMLWNLGEFGVGESKTITYSYNVSSVPLPAAAWLFAPSLLGLVGIGYRRKVA